MRNDLLNPHQRSKNGSAICRTCGTNFVENCSVEDGKCQVCGKIICSRCGLEWICSLCYKRRIEKGRKKITEVHSPEKLVVSKFEKLLKKKGYFKEPIRGRKLEPSIDHNHLNYFLKSASNTIGDEKTRFPEYGADLPNESSQGNEHNDQVPKIKNWEQNWLFKKRTNNEVFKPVAMFLPSSYYDTKAQIGGVNIDDLSDLSDYSDSEIESILN